MPFPPVTRFFSISSLEAERALGISRQSLDHFCTQGMPHELDGSGFKKYHLHQVHKWIVEKEGKRIYEKHKDRIEDGDNRKNNLLRIKEESAQMDLDNKKGKLIDKEEATRDLMMLADHVRNGFQALGDELSNECSHKTDKQVKKIIDREVHAILKELAKGPK